jgi:adenine C2-methylase RlmN of 23S rRNA A2503 and tRNA A37
VSTLYLIGYDVLGKSAEEGIRYAWSHISSDFYVESAAFSQRSKLSSDNVCGYTTSVSSGCILKSKNLSCKFCRTGTQLPYGNKLKAIEIAKQNVFMVLTDMYCSEHENIKTNMREFAYMGQGEPGFSYETLREAILITDIVMSNIEQKVFRHILATSGVPDMLKLYINDINNNVFSQKTTIHFSLHRTKNRHMIMPIDNLHPYGETLSEIYRIYDITQEKPCIGILLFKKFIPRGDSKSFTTNIKTIKEILNELNPEKVRLSFCEFNSSSDLGTYEQFGEDLSNSILLLAKNKGFESKLFSSFGKEEITACGMLGGTPPGNIPSGKWKNLEKKSDELISDALDILNHKKREVLT